jgi:hypothetical protein
LWQEYNLKYVDLIEEQLNEALTTYRNLVAWRHIRINVACECVVSRKSWARS